MTPAPTSQLRACAMAPGEAAALAGIWRRAWASAHPDARPLEPIGHWLARVSTEFTPPAELRVVERAGQLLAFALLHPPRRYVAQLYVDPHLHGQGCGRQLLDEACRRMPGGWRLHVGRPTAPPNVSTRTTACCAARSTTIQPPVASVLNTIGARATCETR